MTGGRYAAGTDVSSDRSRVEIEGTVRRYGASGFAYGWEETRAIVEFAMRGRRVRFVVKLPDPHEREFTHTPARGLERSNAERLQAWEQACRQRWRALALVVKAKLEAVEAGISEFDSEFLAHLVLPNGQTVGEWAVPQVEQSYATGTMPAPMLQLEARR